MGINRNQNVYQDAISIPGAQQAHTVLAASKTVAVFDAEDARDLLCVIGIHKYLKTSFGANANLNFIAKVAGANPPAITIAFVVAGTNTPLTVVVASNAITINVATNGAGAATSTASQVLAAVQASVAATALVGAELQAGNDGTGVVAALGATGLGGPAGTNPTLDCKLQGTIDGAVNFFDVAAFAQKTALSLESRLFANVGMKNQWVITLGGTTPEFGVSITAIHRPYAS